MDFLAFLDHAVFFNQMEVISNLEFDHHDGTQPPTAQMRVSYDGTMCSMPVTILYDKRWKAKNEPDFFEIPLKMRFDMTSVSNLVLPPESSDDDSSARSFHTNTSFVPSGLFADSADDSESESEESESESEPPLFSMEESEASDKEDDDSTYVSDVSIVAVGKEGLRSADVDDVAWEITEDLITMGEAKLSNPKFVCLDCVKNPGNCKECNKWMWRKEYWM